MGSKIDSQMQQIYSDCVHKGGSSEQKIAQPEAMKLITRAETLNNSYTSSCFSSSNRGNKYLKKLVNENPNSFTKEGHDTIQSYLSTGRVPSSMRMPSNASNIIERPGAASVGNPAVGPAPVQPIINAPHVNTNAVSANSRNISNGVSSNNRNNSGANTIPNNSSSSRRANPNVNNNTANNSSPSMRNNSSANTTVPNNSSSSHRAGSGIGNNIPSNSSSIRNNSNVNTNIPHTTTSSHHASSRVNNNIPNNSSSNRPNPSPTLPGSSASVVPPIPTIPGVSPTIPGASASVVPPIPTIPSMNPTLPGASASVVPSIPTIPGVSPTIPGARASVVPPIPTIPGVSSTIPGASASVVPPIPTIPSMNATLPGSSASVVPPIPTIPGLNATLPGSSASVVPSTPIIPGVSPMLPGSSASVVPPIPTIPSGSPTLPGSSASVIPNAPNSGSPALRTNLSANAPISSRVTPPTDAPNLAPGIAPPSTPPAGAPAAGSINTSPVAGGLAPTPVVPAAPISSAGSGVVGVFGKEILNFQAAKSTWACHWWPLKEQKRGGDPINNLYATGGPLDKLDMITGGSARDYEYQKNRKEFGAGRQYDWWGHCNNASEAACVLQAPKHNVVMKAQNGADVTFSKSDIQGLLVKVTPSLVNNVDFRGERYNNGSKDNPNDPKPELFLQTLQEWAKDGLPFVLDIDPKEQVWNFPYDKAKVFESDKAPQGFSGGLASDGSVKYYHIEMSGTGFDNKARVYECYIQRNSSGGVVSSAWIKTPNSHNNPDFMWRPHPVGDLMNKASWQLRGKPSNPNVDPQVIYDIYIKSLA